MSAILRKFTQQLDYIKQSNAPLDTYGGRPETGVYEKKLADISDLIRKPAIGIDDLVCLSTF